MEIPNWEYSPLIMKKALYPGSFDPITCGHIDIINRSLQLFDELIVAVTDNTQKDTTFSIEQRIRFIEEEYLDKPQLQVVPFNGLLVSFMKENNINTAIRGIRVFSDFEYEFQMALTNKQLYPDFEVIFLLSEISHTNLSSSLIKDIIRYHGDYDSFIPESVKKYLRLQPKEFL
jgi:pantetheine-phosphate adenylyltransferase